MRSIGCYNSGMATKYATVQKRCSKCGNIYTGPFQGSTCPHCGHRPDVDWMTRLLCFFIPPFALINFLTAASVEQEKAKDGMRAAGLGVLFYVVSLMLLLSIG
jgi:hypothetical protein